MGIFLRAKHWQLFLVIFALPMIFYIAIFVNIFAALATNVGTNAAPDPAIMFSWLKWFPVLMVILLGTIMGWEWSIAIGLQKFIPAGVKMNTTLFKVFFFSPVVYFIVLGIFIFQMFNGFFLPAVSSGIAPAAPPTGLLVTMVIIFPLHFYSIFCMFYIIFFAAKTLRTAELQREVTFSDFVGEFFMLMFYFVGVWFIQPRINKLYEGAIPSNDLSDNYMPPQNY